MEARFMGACPRAISLKLAFAIMLVPVIVATESAQSQTFSVLYSFTGSPDAANPIASLIRDAAGNPYGTTYSGGPSDLGTVFKLDATGKETVLYAFTGTGGDGEHPTAGLITDARGNLYGTTEYGGGSSNGTVFRLGASDKETILYTFTGGSDGRYPRGGLVRDALGNFYGTTLWGGAYGNGVVFKLGGPHKQTVLHSFADGRDGSDPYSSLILDKTDNLYGTTLFGGSGYGTVFKVTKAGKETVLHSFNGARGHAPYAALIQDNTGNLYGTTSSGGTSDGGMVFKLSKAGKETVLYSFTGTSGDGTYPQAALIRDAAGNLYGTTWKGAGTGCGGIGCGTVFKVDSTGKETVLHIFTGGTDGGGPVGGLIRDASGNLYGTASEGGVAGYGVVFKLTP
jgi:uncharacterized repeat protein (TIGR03803 family)